MSYEMQEMDSLPSVPRGEGTETSTMKPTTRLIRLARAAFAPQIINVDSQIATAILRDYIGEWSERSASPGGTPTLQTTLKVSAFGKTAPGIPVSLFLGGEKVASGETDQNGLVTFPSEYSEVGSYQYTAVIGDQLPLLPEGSPRATRFLVGVWLIAVFCRNVTDTWLRWVGRARWRPLPWMFWTEQPSSVVGLGYPGVDRPIGFIDVVPVPQGTTVPIEIGNSGWCNTPERFPTSEKCCEYAKNTWWDMFICATNDPKQIPETVAGRANKVGGDRVNLDYHLKYEASSSGVTYKGRYLKYQRCPWEAGTAPTDP